MKEKPIILNTDMVKAVLSGNKVSTRRPIKGLDSEWIYSGFITGSTDKKLKGCCNWKKEKDSISYSEHFYKKPPYQKNDVLYVRETWGTFEDCHIDNEDQRYFYRADMDSDSEEIRQDYIRIGYSYQFKPSIHMPRKAARIFLKVTNVKVERLQDMKKSEAVNEGVYISGGLYHGTTEKNGCKGGYSNPINAFKSIWNSIYSNWDSNPWVWVIDFEVVK